MARRFGRELRIARVAAGLTQARLARLAEVSQQEVSLAERGDQRVSLSVRCRLGAACGHEVGWGLYPVASVRLRDSGQLGIADVVTAEVGTAWSVQMEATLSADDLRAADLLLTSRAERILIEIERVIVDLQAQLRSAQRKREAFAALDSRPVRVVLAILDTRANRRRLAPHLPLLERTLPARSSRIWRALRSGEPLGADGILFVPMPRTSTASATNAFGPTS